jgi:hypothetical protein
VSAPNPKLNDPTDTVIKGPFGEDVDGTGSDDRHEGQAAEIPKLHERSVSQNTTYSPRCLDVLAELQRQLREGGHEATLKPFGASDLVEILAELAAPRLVGKHKPDLGRVLRSIAEFKGKAPAKAKRSRKSKG